MANLAVSNTFTAGTEITAAPFNTNFSDIVTYINNRNGGGTAWDALNVTGTSTLTGAITASSTLAVTGAITATGGIANLFGYRRPNLVYSSATAVNVENNTGTSNQTTIVFPDGTIRSVTEDVSSTHKYRQFLITATAEFITGTEDSGLYSGLSETTNTWYAIYAVKSQINTANFVLVGTTTLPLQANFATLNTNLGTNSWVYLGMIRNGDNSGATGDILSFVQSGNETAFRNACTGNDGTLFGTRLATTAGATSVTYTYAAGTGATDIPNHISIGAVGVSNGTAFAFKNAANTVTIGNLSGGGTLRADVHVTAGFLCSGTSTTRDIVLSGFYDPLLDGTHQVL